MAPWLVVGLGNPGPKYAKNRHNVGFFVIDELARLMSASFKDKFKGQYAKGRLGSDEVILLKPMTFMNASGTSVGPAATFFKVPLQRVIVIHDELDLDFDTLRLKVGGGHAGHNGLRSIFQHFGKDFVRLRFGIGRPVHGDVSRWVLSDFSKDEQISLGTRIDDAAKAVERAIADGANSAMNVVNQK